jgi:hypothetical protein
MYRSGCPVRPSSMPPGGPSQPCRCTSVCNFQVVVCNRTCISCVGRGRRRGLPGCEGRLQRGASQQLRRRRPLLAPGLCSDMSRLVEQERVFVHQLRTRSDGLTRRMCAAAFTSPSVLFSSRRFKVRRSAPLKTGLMSLSMKYVENLRSRLWYVYSASSLCRHLANITCMLCEPHAVLHPQRQCLMGQECGQAWQAET